jgi:hypothetical protein
VAALDVVKLANWLLYNSYFLSVGSANDFKHLRSKLSRRYCVSPKFLQRQGALSDLSIRKLGRDFCSRSSVLVHAGGRSKTVASAGVIADFASPADSRVISEGAVWS